MRVQMLTAITGTRDGEDWPPVGAVADLPDALASDLIASGHAAEVEAPVVEAASVEPAENAAQSKPRRRRATSQE